MTIQVINGYTFMIDREHGIIKVMNKKGHIIKYEIENMTDHDIEQIKNAFKNNKINEVLG